MPNTPLSHYRIVSKIGAGGMGEVYLAQDTKLDRKVALKVLPSDVAANQDRMERFIQEAKAAAALNHPNIAHIYEIGESDGTNFIAMEFVDGKTLREKIHGEKSELRVLLKHLLQVAEGLAKAHASGIVHRDLKPDNIMITRDGHAKILDFGLAKLLETAGQKPDREGGLGSSEVATAMMPVQHSTPGVVMGTVGYMSPEQAQAKPVDQRSDIFSFGCILYETATGRKPFAGDSVVDTLHRIIYEPAPAITDFNPSASPELQRVIRKCLAKEPEKRYQTIRDTANDLEELLEEMKGVSDIERSVAPSTSATTSSAPGSTDDDVRVESTASVSQQPASSAEYVFSGVKQHKLAAVIALLVLVVGAVGLGLYLRARNTVAAIESIAVMPFVNASGNSEVEYLSDGLTESLITSLSQLPKLSVKARSSVFRYKGKDASPQQVGKELNVQAIVNGRVVQRGNDLTLHIELVDVDTETALWSADYNRSMTDLVSLPSEIARELSSKLRLKLSDADKQKLTKNYTQNTEAYQAYLKGQYYWNKGWNKGLATGFEKSRDYYQQAIDLDPTYALAYAGLADYYGFAFANGLFPPEEKWAKAEEETANKALALDPTLGEAYNPLAAAKLYYHRDWPAAERYFRRGIELSPNFAEMRHHYALCLVLFGRDEEALGEMQRAIELDPLSLRFNWNWARILFFMRQYDRAIDQYRKTLELDQNFAPAHEWLGDAYEQKGMHREAIAEWGKALTLSGQGEQASLLERTYAASGFETAVRALAQKELERLNEKTGRGEYVPAAEYVMAYLQLGDKEKVFGWLAKAVEERNRFALEFKVNPIFDSLRSDPRFQDLLRRIGFPQ